MKKHPKCGFLGIMLKIDKALIHSVQFKDGYSFKYKIPDTTKVSKSSSR